MAGGGFRIPEYKILQEHCIESPLNSPFDLEIIFQIMKVSKGDEELQRYRIPWTLSIRRIVLPTTIGMKSHICETLPTTILVKFCLQESLKMVIPNKSGQPETLPTVICMRSGCLEELPTVVRLKSENTESLRIVIPSPSGHPES